MENDVKELEPKLKEKVKKNVLYIGILSIVMLFAGFTSAYVVMMKDGFWLKLNLPNAFWISTAIILISSVTIHLALRSAKKDDKKGIKLFMTLTVVLGLAFTYFQFNGWKKLYETGNSFIAPTLNPAPYGKEFVLRYNGEEVYFDGGDFEIHGEIVSADIENKLINFSKKIFDKGFQGPYSGLDYGKEILIVHKPTGAHISVDNDQFFIEGKQMPLEKRIDLINFSHTVYNKVGFFFNRGDYGKDYSLMWNGKSVDYIDGNLTIEGKPLDGNQINILESDQNMTGTFIHLFSGVHWLHLFGGLWYLIVLLSKSYKGVYGKEDHLQIKLGGIYWHFLDILWVYLFLFLHFIH